MLHGRIERRILQVLHAEASATVAQLVDRVRAGDASRPTSSQPTRSEIEIVRHALRNLCKRRFIEVTRHGRVIHAHLRKQSVPKAAPMKQIALVMLLLMASHALADPQARIYDARGNSIGTATTSNNTTTFRDAKGVTTVTTQHLPNGGIWVRDARGNTLGISTTK